MLIFHPLPLIEGDPKGVNFPVLWPGRFLLHKISTFGQRLAGAHSKQHSLALPIQQLLIEHLPMSALLLGTEQSGAQQMSPLSSAAFLDAPGFPAGCLRAEPRAVPWAQAAPTHSLNSHLPFDLVALPSARLAQSINNCKIRI